MVDPVEKVITHGPETLDRANPEIHETFPSTVIFFITQVLVMILLPIVNVGAVLSILYICCALVTLPALSSTQAYQVKMPSVVNVGAVVLPH